jgi:hypothetical protein
MTKLVQKQSGSESVASNAFKGKQSAIPEKTESHLPGYYLRIALQSPNIRTASQALVQIENYQEFLLTVIETRQDIIAKKALQMLLANPYDMPYVHEAFKLLAKNENVAVQKTMVLYMEKELTTYQDFISKLNESIALKGNGKHFTFDDFDNNFDIDCAAEFVRGIKDPALHVRANKALSSLKSSMYTILNLMARHDIIAGIE